MGTLPLNIFPQYIAAEKMQYVVRATVQGMKAMPYLFLKMIRFLPDW